MTKDGFVRKHAVVDDAYQDMNNRLKVENSTFYRLRSAFESQLDKVVTMTAERKDALRANRDKTMQQLKALREQKTALEKVLERVCVAALESYDPDGGGDGGTIV